MGVEGVLDGARRRISELGLNRIPKEFGELLEGGVGRGGGEGGEEARDEGVAQSLLGLDEGGSDDLPVDVSLADEVTRALHLVVEIPGPLAEELARTVDTFAAD